MSSVSSALLEKGSHSRQLGSTGLQLCHYVTNCVQKRTAHMLTPASKETKPTISSKQTESVEAFSQCLFTMSHSVKDKVPVAFKANH